MDKITSGLEGGIAPGGTNQVIPAGMDGVGEGAVPSNRWVTCPARALLTGAKIYTHLIRRFPPFVGDFPLNRHIPLSMP